MAESMEKPPPYAPTYEDVENKGAPHGGYGGMPSGYVGAPPVFVPPGYQPSPQGQYQPVPQNQYQQYPSGQVMGRDYPNYGSTVYVHQPHPATQVILVGSCPACRIGVLEDDFTGLGICLAVFCFPIGVLCCLAMKQRKCPNCGAIFG